MMNYGATKTRIFGQMTSRGFAAHASHGDDTNPSGMLTHGETLQQPRCGSIATLA